MKIETRNFNELVGETTTTFTRALKKKIKKKLRIDFIATTKGGKRCKPSVKITPPHNVECYDYSKKEKEDVKVFE